jgi:hypothetical protein
MPGGLRRVRMRLGMMLGGFVRMMFGMHAVAVRDMRMMAGKMMLAFFVMLGGFAMMLGGLFVMVGGRFVVFGLGQS